MQHHEEIFFHADCQGHAARKRDRWNRALQFPMRSSRSRGFFCQPVPVLPAFLRRGRRVVTIELDERVDEEASHRRGAELCGQLGVLKQPVCIPRGPVWIVTVGDPPLIVFLFR